MVDIVSPEWLADRLGAVHVIDVRDAWEYDAIGHIPGAVAVPFDRFRADEHATEAGTEDGDRRGMLPPREEFQAILREAGVDVGGDVVAYDDTHGVFAARFLMTAALLGHDPDTVHLLDGDFSRWRLEHETSEATPSPAPTQYVLEPPEDTPLVGPEAVAAALEDGETVLVDTREDWEYEEGHIPGAVLLDWRELVDEETRGILPRDEAEAVLADRAITRDRPVLLYCNTARRISHTYVVLSHLGYPDVSFYEGSLTEWERTGRPIETGSTE
jgi:thiosulfate/3-mercaptopyruvate sulfurtransferase